MDLEGLFLKFAQQVSTMSGLLPAPYIEAFEKAQNNSKPRPTSQITKRITSELGDDFDNLFLNFDEKPLGVASIGQVHKAQLKTGETVAVKVQHLNIDQIAQLDLQLIKKLLKVVQFFIKTPGFDSVNEEVSKMIYEELDYQNEAVQMNAIAKSLRKNNSIIIPKVFSKYSTKKVLTMEFIEAEKITNTAFLEKQNIDKDSLSTSLLEVFSRNIFIDGLFHADPHPGNVLVNENGQIVLLDFGAVGTLSNNMKEGLIILMQAAILKDENLMISGFKQMGFINNAPGIDKVCKKIIRVLGDFLVNEIKIEKFNVSEINLEQINLKKVLKLLESIDLKEVEEVVKIPKDWVLLNRTIALVLGITSTLSPELDVYKTVKPNLLRMAIQKESIGMILKTSIQQQALRVISLPRKVELFLEQAENGELEVNVKSRKTEVKLMYALIQQVIFLAGCSVCFYFYKEHNNPPLLYISIGGALLFIKSFLYGWYYKRKLTA